MLFDTYMYHVSIMCIQKYIDVSFVLFVHSIEFSVMELIYCRFSNNEYENIIYDEIPKRNRTTTKNIKFMN